MSTVLMYENYIILINADMQNSLVNICTIWSDNASIVWSEIVWIHKDSF